MKNQVSETHYCNPAGGKWRQKDQQFKASLNYLKSNLQATTQKQPYYVPGTSDMGQCIKPFLFVGGGVMWAVQRKTRTNIHSG